MTIKIKNHALPDAILAQHVAILGKTRSGKSSVLRLLVETLLERKERVCIIDPKGDWWGIKSSADGKRAGYEVVIFGGPKGDLPLNEHAGSNVAELVTGGNRPCVIDLGGWMVGERTRFFVDFAATLFRTLDAPLFLVVDEVHNFAPQSKLFKDPHANKMLHWANRLGSEGAGKGLVILSASQRPQKVHKDFLTCAETLVAMRVIHQLDRNAVKEWIDGAGDPARGKDVLNTLASMARGEGWVWSPEAGFGPERVKFPLFKTYDSFAAPVGGQAKRLTGWAEVNIDAEKKKLLAIVEAAKANDPKELKKQIAELKRQLSAKSTAGPEALAAAEARGVALGWADAKRELEQLHKTIGEREGRLAKIESLAHLNGDATKVVQHAAPAPKKPDPKPRASFTEHRLVTPSGDLGKGERKILTAIAQHGAGVSREQLTVLTGYKRSSRDTYLQRLRQSGLIEDGDAITATDEGVTALGANFEVLPTGDALLIWWLDRLPAGEAKLLGELVKVYPDSISRDELTELTGYKRSSRDTYLQRLNSRKLIDVRGSNIGAAEILFD